MAILFGQFAAMAFGVVDTMMTGHSSATDLAAMGLGASIYGSVFVSLLGVVLKRQGAATVQSASAGS